jgi:hypothetical protein
MSFDKPTRNKLASMVGDCRRLLTDDIRHQLQAVYGLQPDGTALPVSSLSHLDERGREVSSALRLWQEHLASTEAGTESQKRKAAFDRLAHESAFTILNRLAALRMCEERGHVIECVRRGLESDGFALYERFSEGVLGGRGETYRIFLERMFAELSVDLGALFDLDAPQSLVFPRERCLEGVLSLLNRADLTHVWANDETIGWIYQYFNSKEERGAMREASAAPRNSRELAVRNQFFTPRYVVEFLVDNTLGRIWYEMRRGETALKERCRYLVRRSIETFLSEGQQSPPLSVRTQDNLTQDELLKQPIHIPSRAKRDPRTIKILDPAVGSGHFLLYAFDLLETIYQEAWEDTNQPTFGDTGKTIRDEFEDLSKLRIALPELILRHNLHGIDIDLRACQIAALALWLRAQQAYQHLGIKGSQRPKIERSNIVCAEPMPGEQGLLDQFLTDLQPKVIGQLVQAVFEKMKLAGEAGALLKIEKEIAEAVVDAKRKWLAGPKPEQGLLFTDIARPRQRELDLDFSGITDEAFWERAEELIYRSLQRYAEQAENGLGYQRRLFAQDAARGFAFIDLCRNRYDIVLMNPPFGSPPEAFEHAKDIYPHSGRDIYGMFVERAHSMRQQAGLIGAILPRTGLFIGTMTDLRKRFYLEQTPLNILLDLGRDVLDTATIRTACYILGQPILAPVVCFRIGNIDQREDKVHSLVEGFLKAEASEDLFIRDRHYFTHFPNSAIAYWIPESLASKLTGLEQLDGSADVRQGIATGDNFRFLRLLTELPAGHEGFSYYSKGGEPVPFVSDESLYVRSALACVEMKANAAQEYGSASRTIKNEDTFGLPGITYSQVNDACLKFRIHPPEALYDMKGPVLFGHDGRERKAFLAFLNSTAVEDFMRMMTDGRQWHVSALKTVPVPRFDAAAFSNLQQLAQDAAVLCQIESSQDETGHYFSFGQHFRSSLGKLSSLQVLEERIDECVWGAYGASQVDVLSIQRQRQLFLERTFARHVRTDTSLGSVPGLALGCAFGRWDLRYATDEKLAPTLPDPFSILPACPPAMLQNQQGLPLTDEHVQRLKTTGHWQYPVEISWDGILVDDSDNANDIVRRVREVLAVVWKAQADAVEQEACDILKTKNLTEYFRKPSLFFADHLQRYSKSKRQAPIYWPLSTRSGSYTLWIYYHRLNDDSLYTALNKYVKPKIDDTEKELRRIESELPNATGREASSLRTTFEETGVFLDELRELRDELARVADLPYKPNLNDGVVITASPLWKLFRLPKWRKELQECWKKLELGDYDWAHLAYTIWPDRVRDVCKSDRSIAIAHDLESLCELAAKPAKKKRSQKIAIEETVPGDEE